MGSRLISLRGSRWSGFTTNTTQDRGDKRLLRLENAYVSSDGSEIRSMPGYKTLLDLSEVNNPSGYSRYIIDAVRPVYETSPFAAHHFFFWNQQSGYQTLRARAKAHHLFAFEQVGDQLVVLGESRFRECPILSSSRQYLKPTHVGAPSGRWTLTLDGSPATNSVFDVSGPGLNGLVAGNVVYVEGVKVSDAALQATIDATLNSRMHEVKSISGPTVTLHTTTSAFAATPLLAGEVHRVRPNRSNAYSTPSGQYVWNENPAHRPDDPIALTAWKVQEPLSIGHTRLEAWPAWVANRQRDFGDLLWDGDTEGVWTNTNGTRGASRREQRRLPYRPSVIALPDRIILAAPQYGCMLQVPMGIPSYHDAWPTSPFTEQRGINYQPNAEYDKPRSLGIPKARLIDATNTPAPTSPSIGDPGTAGLNFNVVAISASPEYGLPPGEYLVSISYEDEAIGEEGLASEPISVYIPDNQYAYTIVLNYIHPGYIMPECLANKINVYIAPPGQTAMAYYASLPLAKLPVLSTVVNGTVFETSARYGFEPCSPAVPAAIYRDLRLPLPGTGASIEDFVDPLRLAPQSASMPRGAAAARYIRGILVAGGAMGNAGPAMELWGSFASGVYIGHDNKLFLPNEIRIRALGDSASTMNPSQDGSIQDQASTLGIGGRCFPDAYSGIEIHSVDMLPAGNTTQRIDRVLNRRAETTVGPGYHLLHHDRLACTRNIWDYTRPAGISPREQPVERQRSHVWYRMPRGQVQIGDPGAPNRASKAAIQFLDPASGDDVTAIGNLSGNAVICTRKETYSLAWYRSPSGETPQLVTSEHGCIGANTMVEFDGGLAWIGEHGPVAIGESLQFIGSAVTELFHGPRRRYLADSRGMMRHSWSCHDKNRGLIYWGMVTKDSTVVVRDEDIDWTYVQATDQIRSRFPCDEVLIWNYRADAFSTWRPPAGHEILWMRTVRLFNGETRIAFLAADQRIYAFDDDAGEGNADTGPFQILNDGDNSTTLQFFCLFPGTDGMAQTGRDGGTWIRAGMRIEFLDNRKGNALVASNTIAEVLSISGNTVTVRMSNAMTWKSSAKGPWFVMVGTRAPMLIMSTYYGAETLDNLSVQGVQMRYSLAGSGASVAKVQAIVNSTPAALSGKVVSFTPEDAWPSLGNAFGETDVPGGNRKAFKQGHYDAPEGAIVVTIAGGARVAIQDIALEVS